MNDRRRGANPPKSESGIISPVFSIDDMRAKSVSAGNGSCISERMVLSVISGIFVSWILRMRSLCSNAERTLIKDHCLTPLTCMMIGKAGQIRSISHARFPGLAV